MHAHCFSTLVHSHDYAGKYVIIKVTIAQVKMTPRRHIVYTYMYEFHLIDVFNFKLFVLFTRTELLQHNQVAHGRHRSPEKQFLAKNLLLIWHFGSEKKHFIGKLYLNLSYSLCIFPYLSEK